MKYTIQLLEGAEFSSDKKHADQLTIPVIFVSNKRPQDDLKNEIIKAFNNRFTVIEE